MTFCWLPPDSSPTGWPGPDDTSDSAAGERCRGGGPAAGPQQAEPVGQLPGDGHRGVLGDAEVRDEALGAAVLRDVADPGALRGGAPAGRDRAGRAAGPRRRVLASAPAMTRPRVATPALSRPVTPTTSPASHPQRDAGQAAAGRVGGQVRRRRAPRARPPLRRQPALPVRGRPARPPRSRPARRRPSPRPGRPCRGWRSARSAPARRRAARRRPGRSRRPLPGGARCKGRRRPPSVSWRTRSNSRRTAWRSSAAVGSSSSTHLAPRASARAISTICSCSTDRSRHGVSGVDVEAPLAHDVAGPARASRASSPPAARAAEEDVLRDRQVAARSSSAGRPWRSTRASARCRRRAARARRRTAPCPRPARSGRTGSRPGSTCPRRCGRPGRGTARRRWTGRRRAARGWCRTASRRRSPRRARCCRALASGGPLEVMACPFLGGTRRPALRAGVPATGLARTRRRRRRARLPYTLPHSVWSVTAVVVTDAGQAVDRAGQRERGWRPWSRTARRSGRRGWCRPGR